VSACSLREANFSGLLSRLAAFRSRHRGGQLRVPFAHLFGIVRGILLKGSGWAEIVPELWPIALFTLVAGAIALNRYRDTLD
jgi:uncharacterized membrane protein HdeD (DUF308 family)